MILSHPVCDEWNEREPKKQMEVGPQDAPVHFPDGMEHMMVIVPVDADKKETEQILTERRHDACEGGPVRTTRDRQFEHHDGDNDGDDAITECLHAALCHSSCTFFSFVRV